MTLRQMQYSESVARTHNLTKSAQELFISQPSLSVSMKALEQEIKVSLFQRDGTHIRLTDAGQALALEVSSVLKQYEKMQEIISSGNLERNYVRLGFSTLVGDLSAPLICQKFLDSFPKFHIHLTQCSGSELLQKLERRQLDVVLTGQKYSEKPDWSGKFESHPTLESALTFCVGESDPRSLMKSITMEEIAKQPVILPDETFPASVKLESSFVSTSSCAALRYTPFCALFPWALPEASSPRQPAWRCLPSFRFPARNLQKNFTQRLCCSGTKTHIFHRYSMRLFNLHGLLQFDFS